MTTTRSLTLLIRLAGGGALLLGLAIWTGHASTGIPIHMLLGATLVLAMWGTAAIALRRGARRGLAVLVALWGLGLAALGLSQTRLLPGGAHWVIGLAHLLVGAVGISLGVTLAGALAGPAMGRPRQARSTLDHHTGVHS